MLALSSSPTFSSIGWPLEDPISHDQNFPSMGIGTPESFPYFPPTSHSQPEELNFNRSTSFTDNSCDQGMVKKLNHNANERDRRKKINTLYSSLQSLLPGADQMKTLSIPATVSRVVKYIPELQQQVEKLIHKKEELLAEISRQDDDLIQEENHKRKWTEHGYLTAVSVHPLSDRQLAIQVSSSKARTSPLLSEIFTSLEEDGLSIINSSSFVSFGDRVFHNLHFQVEEAIHGVDCKALSEKLVSLYEKREALMY